METRKGDNAYKEEMGMLIKGMYHHHTDCLYGPHYVTNIVPCLIVKYLKRIKLLI